MSKAAATAFVFDLAVKNRLKRIQYRPGLLDAFLAHTGLDPEPP
jgi:hypothetical protein